MRRTTEVWPARDAAIAKAADIIRRGGLVAFPTETVYGLGANALDAVAVQSIFQAKGRPATNPVIVHVASFDDAAPLVHNAPEVARVLATKFWPGPLSLVMPRSPHVPDVVTAGGPTVAVRAPSHPVARLFLRACGVPLAAPSANRSMCLSATRPEHVLRGLAGRIDVILDDGPCPGGLESTVLDVTTDPPTLLRPGLISVAELQSVIGPIQNRPASSNASVVRSPGQMAKHYAPVTPIEFAADDGRKRVAQRLGEGRRVGWLAFGSAPTISSAANEPRMIEMPTTPAAYAARIYDVLHELDLAMLDCIVLSLPPEDNEWLAIHDRLGRMIG